MSSISAFAVLIFELLPWSKFRRVSTSLPASRLPTNNVDRTGIYCPEFRHAGNKFRFSALRGANQRVHFGSVKELLRHDPEKALQIRDLCRWPCLCSLF